MARKNPNGPKNNRGVERIRHKQRPGFRIVSRAILAAFHSAPSPRITVAELTEVAIVIIMGDGYGAEASRDAIEHLLELEDPQYH